MKLVKVLWADHKNFTGLLQCEYCKSEEKIAGPRTEDFLLEVIPKTKCKRCLRSAPTIH